MPEKGRARLRERGWRQRDEQSDEKREREERVRKGESGKRCGGRGGCEGGKTADGIGGAKLLGGGLIKPS